MNRLQHETSPYLLQHSHNPVDWFAWKPEAFETARREGKPLLVSIGYSTCHWCHVMERESFEDAEVAEFMNEHFVCIKVDREERPDVDQIYMEACQIMSGGGGWPLNCFLTPDGRPFYAGTYYPPMPAHQRPSWLQVLMNLSHAWQHRRPEVEEQANRLTDIIRNSGNTFTGNGLHVEDEGSPFSSGMLQNIFNGLQRNFDTEHGGFGGAPKFPGTMSLHYLLCHHFFFKEKQALDHVFFSLKKMANGGIYDHLGGGFARYATDRAWLVPHFEKMLYDNALLVSLLSEAIKCLGISDFGFGISAVPESEIPNSKLTTEPGLQGIFKQAIEETLEWVRREMTSDEGSFYSALDADSEGVEGKFYVWEKQEVEDILGEEAPLFCEFYDVTTHGNWEEKNILWRRWSFEEFAEAKGVETDAFKEKMEAARQSLFAERKKRVHPGLDDKILLDWNALMCSAYAKAYSVLENETYRKTAVQNLDFLLKKMAQADGITLFHTYKNGKAQYDAFLDDYAYLIEALLEVYEITFDTAYLLQAERYIRFVLENFHDRQDNLFYFTSSKQKDVLLRRKDLYDSATPSGNSTMVRNLQRMGILLGKEDWQKLATGMLLTVKEAIEKYPGSFSQWAAALANEVRGIPEIAVVGKEAERLAGQIQKIFLPAKAIMAAPDGDDRYALLEGKTSGGDTLIYVCENYACQAPVKTVEEMKALILKL